MFAGSANFAITAQCTITSNENAPISVTIANAKHEVIKIHLFKLANGKTCFYFIYSRCFHQWFLLTWTFVKKKIKTLRENISEKVFILLSDNG